jgi:hypothetical protein
MKPLASGDRLILQWQIGNSGIIMILLVMPVQASTKTERLV